jgi:hypothetical protein
MAAFLSSLGAASASVERSHGVSLRSPARQCAANTDRPSASLARTAAPLAVFVKNLKHLGTKEILEPTLWSLWIIKSFTAVFRIVQQWRFIFLVIGVLLEIQISLLQLLY